MENNKTGKIALNRSGHKRSRFNCAHDVSTTFSFGDLQPLMCKFMVPDSKCTLDIETLTRFAPMVAPSFGRVKQKMWSMFVPLDEVYPNYDMMMTRTAVSRLNGTYVPQDIPHIGIHQLTGLCLIGAELTVWRNKSANDSTDLHTWEHYHSSTSGEGAVVFNMITTGNRFKESTVITDFSYTGPSVNLNFLLNFNDFGGSESSTGSNAINVPFGWSPKQIVENVDNEVTLDSADFVLLADSPNSASGYYGHKYAYAFRLSAWGKRMRKLLIGLGYPLSLTDRKDVSLLPLLAWFRGYYELFGLNLYSNFEQTACFSLVQYISQMFITNYNDHGFTGSLWDSTESILWKFFREVADCYVTESTDYVSGHLERPGTVSSSTGAGYQMAFDEQSFLNSSSSFIDTSVVQSKFLARFSSAASTTSGGQSTGLVYDQVAHGALDEKMLKLFYRWTNKQSVLGNDVAKLLREFGLGQYLDEINVDFIGYDETQLWIHDVTATADTFNNSTDSGMHLGEYAGKSVNGGKSRTHSYETKKAGYWITYAAVVPAAGYCQGYDHTLMALKPFDMYNPDLDGLGYEATPKAEIVGYGQVSSTASSNGSSLTFGYVPRYTGFKIQQNKLNGDFSLMSTRAAYLPYTLDKYMPINERVVTDFQADSTNHLTTWRPGMTFGNMPVAGNIWRYNFKYGWMGNLNRIFVNDSDLTAIRRNFFDVVSDYGLDGNSFYEYAHQSYDNMMTHAIVNLQYYAPMKPIGMSFETYDDEAGVNTSVEKA